MSLTREQLSALQSVPLGSMPNKVRLARTMLGIKQAELARAIEIAAPDLSDIEHGKYKEIGLTKLQRLAGFFGCHIEDLFPRREAVA